MSFSRGRNDRSRPHGGGRPHSRQRRHSSSTFSSAKSEDSRPKKPYRSTESQSERSEERPRNGLKRNQRSGFRGNSSFPRDKKAPRFSAKSRPRPFKDDDKTKRPARDEQLEECILPPGLEPRSDEPELPPGYENVDMPRSLNAGLRSLNKQMAAKVAGHIVYASQIAEEDPQMALRHAQVARRLASRLPIVREFCADIAYLAEDFPVALTEFRAIYRMSGNDDYLPVIADCERATGRLDAALRTVQQAKKRTLTPPQRTELILVESGIRADMGQKDEAMRLLKNAISAQIGNQIDQARLRYAYADALAHHGHDKAARQWFASASAYDVDHVLPIAHRLAELDGTVYEDDEFDILTVDTDEEIDD